jgi:hypothetical protein
MNVLRTALLLLALFGAAGLARAEEAEETHTVTGFGTDKKGARANALEEARKLVRQLLPSEFGAANWGLDSPAFSAELLREDGVVHELNTVASALPRGEPGYEAHYRVKLTPEYIDKVRGMVRAEASQRRQFLVGKVLAGIVVVLLVVSGYLRLEEWSRGYATRLLRLAAVIVLVLAGLALWLIG